MEEVGGLEAGEGGADDRLVRPVDDQAGSAAGSLALEARAGRAVGRDIDRAASRPASRACSSVLPTAATCGSVKVTRGRAELFRGRLDLAAEQVLRRDPGLVLADVGEAAPDR